MYYLKQIAIKSIALSASVVLLVLLADACNDLHKPGLADGLKSLIPSYIQDSVYLSAANNFSIEKASLGRFFFYDRRMSFNQTKSCSSCHDPKFSFTDGYRRSIGALGDNHQHNAAPLINIVFNKYLTLADSSVHFPEQQINNPMFHDQPAELGWKGNEPMIMARLKKDSFYTRQMKSVYPADSDPFSMKNIQSCIASFVKTILSFDSRYDRYKYGSNQAALSAAEKSGMDLFFSKKLGCSNCHGGINFSTPVIRDSKGNAAYYQNTGLYNIDGAGAYPGYDQGLIQYTKNPADMGRYRIPTLRNLAFTAPYFHDGTALSLEEVLSVYENAGRNNTTGVYAGDGRKNPFKNPLINGFRLTSQQEKELMSFLLSLSDSSVCNNPLYANPFKEDETKK
jgi:cytochrome c peroxidase